MKCKDFIKYCNADPKIKKVCGLRGIKLSAALLVEENILPDNNGEYEQQQKNDLYNKLSDNGKVFTSVPKSKPKIESDLRAMKARQLVAKIDFSLSLELKNFMLLTLSHDFNTDIVSIRKKLGVPDDGLEDIADGKKWSERVNEGAESEGIVSPHMPPPRYPNMKESLFYKAQEEIEKLIKKYPSLERMLATYYLFWDINSPAEIINFFNAYYAFHEKMRAKTAESMFFLSGEWEQLSPPNGGKLVDRLNKSFDITFRITGNSLEKRYFDDFFKKNFTVIKKEFEAYTKQKSNEEREFKNHWLLYFSNKTLGYKPQIVMRWHNQYGDDIQPANFKKIILRINQRVIGLEKGDK